MEYIENTDKQSVKNFTDKFIMVYTIGLIMTFPFSFFVGELIGIFLPNNFFV